MQLCTSKLELQKPEFTTLEKASVSTRTCISWELFIFISITTRKTMIEGRTTPGIKLILNGQIGLAAVKKKKKAIFIIQQK
jgi:hypothetical protein